MIHDALIFAGGFVCGAVAMAAGVVFFLLWVTEPMWRQDALNDISSERMPLPDAMGP